MERTFEKVAGELDGGLPAGPAWHRSLLDSMALDLPKIRPPVLGTRTVNDLAEFLRFRHLLGNLYGYELDWSRLKALLARLPETWQTVRRELDRFLAFLDAGSDGSSG